MSSRIRCCSSCLALHRAAGGGSASVCVNRGEVRMVCLCVCMNVVRCQVRVGVCGSIFISGCQGGDTLMNGAE